MAIKSKSFINCIRISLLCLVSLTLFGCAGTVYQQYDGQLGYQEAHDSKDRLVITYIATDSTDWFSVGTLVDQRIAEREAEDPCVEYTKVREEKSEQRVTIERQHDSQYTTVLGLNAEWSIQTHERIDLNIPATVKVYKRVLEPRNQCSG